MEQKHLSKKWILAGAIYAVLLLLTVTAGNIDTINAWLGTFWRILRPVAFGLAFAYILNPFFNFFERWVFGRLRPAGLRRGAALLFAYLAILAIFLCFFVLIIPQLVESIVSLFQNHEAFAGSIADYVNTLIRPINKFFGQWTGNETLISYLSAEGIMSFFANAWESMDFGKDGGLLSMDNLSQITGVISDAVAIVADIGFAIFISLYYLVAKEKREAQIMRARNALFSDKVNGRISRIIGIIDRSFGGFIKGKVFESVVIWILTYVIFEIFDIPFSILLSACIAIANVIPIIGIVIGAVPSGVIVLLSEPAKLVPFIVIVLLVWQLDANIIAPKVLGDNTGVSSLCVIIAIATMGNLWGFAGMVLGVPLFASILKIADYYTEKRLQIKGLPSDIESYYPSDALVDPVKDSHKTSDKMVKRLEKNILRITAELQTKKREELTRRDRLRLKLYRLGRKHKLLSEIEDSTIVQYLTYEEQARILRASDARYEEHRQEKQPTQAKED